MLPVLTNCQKLATKIRNTSSLSRLFDTTIKLHCETRWGTALALFRSLLKAKDTIDSLQASCTADALEEDPEAYDLDASELDWFLILEAIDLLKHIETLLTRLESESTPTLSTVLPYIYGVRNTSQDRRGHFPWLGEGGKLFWILMLKAFTRCFGSVVVRDIGIGKEKLALLLQLGDVGLNGLPIVRASADNLLEVINERVQALDFAVRPTFDPVLATQLLQQSRARSW
jgi:hypothetical protein